MRIELTIDEALLAELGAIARREGLTVEHVVDRAIRLRLRTIDGSARGQAPGSTASMGVPDGVDLVRSLALADALHDAELVSRLRRRK